MKLCLFSGDSRNILIPTAYGCKIFEQNVQTFFIENPDEEDIKMQFRYVIEHLKITSVKLSVQKSLTKMQTTTKEHQESLKKHKTDDNGP